MDTISFYDSTKATQKLAKMVLQHRYSGGTFSDTLAVDDTVGVDAIGAVITALTADSLDLAFIACELFDTGGSAIMNYDSYAKIRAKMKTASKGTLITSGTATAGAATTITLAVGASGVIDYYNLMVIVTTGGTGSGQVKTILAYTGATHVAEVGGAAWGVTPDATTTYEIYDMSAVILRLGCVANTADLLGKGAALKAWEAVYPGYTAPLVVHFCSMVEGSITDVEESGFKFAQHSGTAAAVAAGTITLDATPGKGIIATVANIATNDYFKDKYVYITSATAGAGQLRKIASYVGETRVATLESNWTVPPTGTVIYRVVDGPDLEALNFTNLQDFKGRIFGDVAAKVAAKAIFNDDSSDAAKAIFANMIDKNDRLNKWMDAGVTGVTPEQDLDYFWEKFMFAGYWGWKYSILP